MKELDKEEKQEVIARNVARLFVKTTALRLSTLCRHSQLWSQIIYAAKMFFIAKMEFLVLDRCRRKACTP